MTNKSKDSMTSKYSIKFPRFRSLSHRNKHGKWLAWFECQTCGSGVLRRGSKRAYARGGCNICADRGSKFHPGATQTIVRDEIPGFVRMAESQYGRDMVVLTCKCGCGAEKVCIVRGDDRRPSHFRNCKGYSRSNNYSGLFGVSKSGEYFRPQINIGKQYFIKNYSDPMEAAIARDQLIIDLDLDVKFSLSKAQREAYCGGEKKYLSPVKIDTNILVEPSGNLALIITRDGDTLRKTFKTIEEAREAKEQFLFGIEMIRIANG